MIISPCAKVSGSCRRPVRVELSSLLKACTVGANTVKGGSSPVSFPNAVSRAMRRVENLLSVARTCPVVGRDDPKYIELSVSQPAWVPPPVRALGGEETPTRTVRAPATVRGNGRWITDNCLTSPVPSISSPGPVHEAIDELAPDPLPFRLQGTGRNLAD